MAQTSNNNTSSSGSTNQNNATKAVNQIFLDEVEALDNAGNDLADLGKSSYL